MPVSTSTNAPTATRCLNRLTTTAVFIAATELFLALPFKKMLLAALRKARIYYLKILNTVLNSTAMSEIRPLRWAI